MTTYKMIDIEGVGETYAKKLEEAGFAFRWYDLEEASRILPIC